MASRLFLALIVLITQFGVECSSKIKIKVISKHQRSDIHVVGAEIHFGNEEGNLEGKPVYNMAHYICHQETHPLQILFKVEKESELTVRLNTAFSSDQFKTHDQKTEVSLEWEAKKINCFIFNIWKPKESGIFELYLNFLKTDQYLYFSSFIYFRIVVEKEEINSTLMLPRVGFLADLIEKKFNEKATDSPGQQEIGKIGKESENNQKEKNIDQKFEETKALVEKLLQDKLVCIGNQQYISKGPEVKFKLGTNSINLKGDGEFTFGFLTKKIEFNEAEKATMNFLSSGSTTGNIQTYFADVNSLGDRTIEFIPKYPYDYENPMPDIKVLI